MAGMARATCCVLQDDRKMAGMARPTCYLLPAGFREADARRLLKGLCYSESRVCNQLHTLTRLMNQDSK